MGGACQSKQVVAIDAVATLAAFKDDTNPAGQEEAAVVLAEYLRDSHDKDLIMALCCQHVPGWQKLVGKLPSSGADRETATNLMKTGVQLVSGARAVNSIHEVKVDPELVRDLIHNADHPPPTKCLFTILLVRGVSTMDLAWWTRAGKQEFRRLSTFRAGKYVAGQVLRTGSRPVVLRRQVMHDAPGGQRGAQHPEGAAPHHRASDTPDSAQHSKYAALRLHNDLRRGRRTDSSAASQRMAAHRAQIDAKLRLCDEQQTGKWTLLKTAVSEHDGALEDESRAEADHACGVVRLQALQTADFVRLRATRLDACLAVPIGVAPKDFEEHADKADHELAARLREAHDAAKDPEQLAGLLQGTQRWARLRACVVATRVAAHAEPETAPAQHWNTSTRKVRTLNASVAALGGVRVGGVAAGFARFVAAPAPEAEAPPAAGVHEL
jgi:hypothetical protein